MFLRTRKNYVQIFLVLMLIIFLLLCLISVNHNTQKFFQSYITNKSVENYKKSNSLSVEIQKPVKVSNGTKTILYWDDFFGQKDFNFGLGSEPFKNCDVKSCYATHNRNDLPVEKYDAVLFHGARFSVKKYGIPSKRSLHQKYIFLSVESYFNTYFEAKTNKNFYNWTMSYKRDSDIFHPYGKFIEKETNYSPPSVQELGSRKKQIAWFVSNCRTKGTRRRQRYVKELQKYIPVDIYGSCGTLKCPLSRSKKCYEILEQTYKFYISFENSLCEDYVTEKVFNVLNYNIVPIVFSFLDYNALFPENSLINANHFINPKQLAEYLWELDKNVTEYLRFFEWKERFIVKDAQRNICELCKKLHEPLLYSNYEDVKDWYFGYGCIE